MLYATNGGLSAPAGVSSGGLVLLDNLSDIAGLSAVELDLTRFYDHKIMVSGMLPSAASYLQARFSNDGGATFETSYYRYTRKDFYLSGSTETKAQNTSADALPLGTGLTYSSSGVNTTILETSQDRGSDVFFTQWHHNNVNYFSSGGCQHFALGANGATHIRIYVTAGSFTRGAVQLYGYGGTNR